MAKSKPGQTRGTGAGRKGGEAVRAADRPAPKKRTGPKRLLTRRMRRAGRVTYPTRKETGITTLMVFAMVTIASVFFLLVDLIIQTGVGFILELGS